MEILLSVDPRDEQTVADTVNAVDPDLIRTKPEQRAHMDGQHLVTFAMHVVNNIDPFSVTIGALIAKHVRIKLEVGGIPLSAKTLKDGIKLVHQLRELIGGEKETKKRAKGKKRK
jgi:hypothetical protein